MTFMRGESWRVCPWRQIRKTDLITIILSKCLKSLWKESPTKEPIEQICLLDNNNNNENPIQLTPEHPPFLQPLDEETKNVD